MNEAKFLCSISEPGKIITPFDTGIRFPEILDFLMEKYEPSISTFSQLVRDSESSAEILREIRTTRFNADERMALLKIFRRCVSPLLDTETTKKIRKVSTDTLVEAYGHTFKPISELKEQFSSITDEYRYSLAALIGEYDTRGQLGYQLTEAFFDWFEDHFANEYSIEGPRGAGRDIELSELYPEFPGSYPCDFVIRRVSDGEVTAIGFARYDSTRGGAQSDDRTGGNSNKVERAKAFDDFTDTPLKLIFLSDGPGLLHRDTWEEACILDGEWGGRVRVVTLKLAASRITTEWLVN